MSIPSPRVKVLLTIALMLQLLTACSKPEQYPKMWSFKQETDGILALRESEGGEYEINTPHGWIAVDRVDSNTNYGTRARQVNFMKKAPNGTWNGMWTFDEDPSGHLSYRGTKLDGPSL